MVADIIEQQAGIERAAVGDRRPSSSGDDDRPSWLNRYSMAIATALTAIFLLAGWLLGRLDLISANVQQALYIAAYLTGGTRAALTALRSLWNRHIDVDLLMV